MPPKGIAKDLSVFNRRERERERDYWLIMLTTFTKKD